MQKFYKSKSTSLVLLINNLCCFFYYKSIKTLLLIKTKLLNSQASAQQKKNATLRQNPVRVGVEHVRQKLRERDPDGEGYQETGGVRVLQPPQPEKLQDKILSRLVVFVLIKLCLQFILLLIKIFFSIVLAYKYTN